MISAKAYATHGPKEQLVPFQFERRDPGSEDVLIEILYCGICHSDIHQARNEWGTSTYPMVPGHEIIGRVIKTGEDVEKFKIGDLAGVGCFVDSCRSCSNCKSGEEQYCENLTSFTYNGLEQDKRTPTHGGYSTHIVADQNYVLRVSSKLPIEGVAPLLCAGITTYSPLKHFNIGTGQKVGVIGLGGLGHMAVKFAVSMGAEVTVFSRSKTKEADAKRFGAKQMVATKPASNLEALQNRFDFILDTVSGEHDINQYLGLLKLDGTMCLVGAPEKPAPVHAFSLIMKRRRLAGSLIGGIRETQEMLDYCADHDIVSDIEVIPIQKVNEAYERTIRGDVRYRFVIDMKSLK